MKHQKETLKGGLKLGPDAQAQVFEALDPEEQVRILKEKIREQQRIILDLAKQHPDEGVRWLERRVAHLNQQVREFKRAATQNTQEVTRQFNQIVSSVISGVAQIVTLVKKVTGKDVLSMTADEYGDFADDISNEEVERVSGELSQRLGLATTEPPPSAQPVPLNRHAEPSIPMAPPVPKDIAPLSQPRHGGGYHSVRGQAGHPKTERPEPLKPPPPPRPRQDTVHGMPVARIAPQSGPRQAPVSQPSAGSRQPPTSSIPADDDVVTEEEASDCGRSTSSYGFPAFRPPH